MRLYTTYKTFSWFYKVIVLQWQKCLQTLSSIMHIFLQQCSLCVYSTQNRSHYFQLVLASISYSKPFTYQTTNTFVRRYFRASSWKRFQKNYLRESSSNGAHRHQWEKTVIEISLMPSIRFYSKTLFIQQNGRLHNSS